MRIFIKKHLRLQPLKNLLKFFGLLEFKNLLLWMIGKRYLEKELGGYYRYIKSNMTLLDLIFIPIKLFCIIIMVLLFITVLPFALLNSIVISEE